MGDKHGERCGVPFSANYKKMSAEMEGSLASLPGLKNTDQKYKCHRNVDSSQTRNFGFIVKAMPV